MDEIRIPRRTFLTGAAALGAATVAGEASALSRLSQLDSIDRPS